MNKYLKILAYFLSANIQSVALIAMALWGGDYLNREFPQGFNWYWVTFSLGILAVAQTFYVVIRAAIRLDREQISKR